MFFYLLQHSTLIEKELDNNLKITKIFLYGGISYIVLHATLFIGGNDSLLYSLKKYFWLFVILDICTIILLNNKDIDLNSILNGIKTSFISNEVNNIKSRNKKILKKHKNNVDNSILEKKVTFSDNNEYSEYLSDSDSDIGTDIDIDEFKQSLNL
jgi:hypothetical protein